MTSKVPTTIFTGFLGSGKTTIIAPLIETLQNQGQQVVYIKNEIGDTDIDTQLMRGKHIISQELLNGCICCTLVGPFISAVNELVTTYSPDRIMIEASGTADAAALALMVSAHPLLYRDGVISVIDVVNFEGYEDLTTTAQNQTKFTDLILFNKVELVDQQRKEAVVGYVRELNTHSPILETRHGHISPDVIFGISSEQLNTLLAEESDSHPANQDRTHARHLSDDEMQAFELPLNKSLDLSQLGELLEHLPKRIFRVKGFVKDRSGQLVLVNGVAGRIDFFPLPAEKVNQPTLQPKLVFIGYQAERVKEQITAQFRNFVR